MKAAATFPPRRYRTLWISDVHLGTSGCKAAALADFLKTHDCEQLYLVGDIIDGWALRSEFYWPQEHSNVVRRILTKAKRGTKVTYVTGNHDEFLRKFVDSALALGNIEIVNEAVHQTADGRRLLVTHGDAFDVITRYHRWIALAGDVLYRATMRANEVLNRGRRLAGLGYWSLSAYAKQRVKTAASIISDFEQSVAHECRRRRFDGVVCGHIHHAEIRPIARITYHNCGDWVESCTALAEDHAGRISVLHASSVERSAQARIGALPLASNAEVRHQRFTVSQPPAHGPHGHCRREKANGEFHDDSRSGADGPGTGGALHGPVRPHQR